MSDINTLKSSNAVSQRNKASQPLQSGAVSSRATVRFDPPSQLSLQEIRTLVLETIG